MFVDNLLACDNWLDKSWKRDRGWGVPSWKIIVSVRKGLKNFLQNKKDLYHAPVIQLAEIARLERVQFRFESEGGHVA